MSHPLLSQLPAVFVCPCWLHTSWEGVCTNGMESTCHHYALAVEEYLFRGEFVCSFLAVTSHCTLLGLLLKLLLAAAGSSQIGILTLWVRQFLTARKGRTHIIRTVIWPDSARLCIFRYLERKLVTCPAPSLVAADVS